MPIDDYKPHNAQLADAYGPHVVGGTLGEHDITVSVTGQKIIKVQQLLGAGGRYGWNRCVELTYDGVILDPSTWHFFPGTLTTGTADVLQGQDPLFPNSTLHNNTAFVSVQLPEGIGANDDPPSKLKGIFETQLVQDYELDEADTPIELGPRYSMNPVLMIADAVIEKAGYGLDALVWEDYFHARDWCAFVLPDTHPRFENGLAWNSETPLDEMLNTICYASCLGWRYTTDASGRMRISILTPEDRASEHHFTLANTTPGRFQQWRRDRRQMPNQMSFAYRDMDDPNLKLIDPPFDIDREQRQDLEGGRVRNPGTVYLGVCRAAQAARTANYHARVEMDVDQMCQEQDDAGYAMHLNTLDRVSVTEPSESWAASDFVVMQYEDQDDGPDQTLYTLREWIAGLYSDTDTTPVQSALHTVNPSRHAQPPAAESVVLTPYLTVQPDGSEARALSGVVKFAGFPAPVGQYGRLEWKQPGGEYRIIGERRPEPVSMQAGFDLGACIPGTHYVRVTCFSDLGRPQAEAPTEAFVVVSDAVTPPAGVTNVVASWDIDGGGIIPWLKGVNTPQRHGEEIEVYRFEILNASLNPVFTVLVRVVGVTPLIWAPFTSPLVTQGPHPEIIVIGADGSITTPGSVDDLYYYVSQPLEQNCVVEFGTDARLPPAGFRIVNADYTPGVTPGPEPPVSSPGYLTTIEGGVPFITPGLGFYTTSKMQPVPGDRFAIEDFNGIGQYHRNWSGVGAIPLRVESSQYKIPARPQVLVQLGVVNGEPQAALRASVRGGLRQFRYGRELMEKLFGVVQTTVRVRITQVSPVAGDGLSVTRTFTH